MKRNLFAICALAAGLSASAQSYQVVVTTKDGEKKVFNTDNVSMMRFEQTPDYMPLNYYIGGLYNPVVSNALYSFTIASAAPDKAGDPAEVGDVQMTLALYAPLSEEAHNAVLPDGYYTMSTGSSDWTCNIEKSGLWIRVDEGEDGVSPGLFIGGAVDVRQDGHNSDIRAEVDLSDGSHLAFSYYGPMEFSVGSGGASSFETDQNITFEGGQGRVWCNWFNHFADDGVVSLYTGSFDNNGVQTEGYWLNLDLYMPKSDEHDANWKPVITDGIYTVDYREEVAYSSYRPYTLTPGRSVDLWGQMATAGTYLSYLAADGRLVTGLVKSGTLTVSDNGSRFVLDFVTDKGIKITGEYNGRPNVFNYIDNSDAPVLPDLDSDVTLDFIDGTVALNYDLGDYIVQNLPTHVLMITHPDMEHGDYLMFDVMSETLELADGTYNVNTTFDNKTAIPGALDYGGSMVFSWYGDLDEVDEEGYNTVLSPIESGSLTISTLSNGDRKFDFNLLTPGGRRITGTWSGQVSTYQEEQQGKVASKRSRLHTGIHPAHDLNRVQAHPARVIAE